MRLEVHVHVNAYWQCKNKKSYIPAMQCKVTHARIILYGIPVASHRKLKYYEPALRVFTIVHVYVVNLVVIKTVHKIFNVQHITLGSISNQCSTCTCEYLAVLETESKPMLLFILRAWFPGHR